MYATYRTCFPRCQQQVESCKALGLFWAVEIGECLCNSTANTVRHGALVRSVAVSKEIGVE